MPRRQRRQKSIIKTIEDFDAYRAKSIAKSSHTFIVHKGYRLMFTDAEVNRAFLRAKKHSGLG